MDLDVQDTNKLVDGIKIPPAPYILNQLHGEMQKDSPEIQVIADIISKDVGISSLILRTVNSSFFGLRSKVQSIQHATSLLGIGFTTNIVAGLALRRNFEESEGTNAPNFWDSPVNVAMVAASLARSLGVAEPDKMYMLGLFHNAGHSLMMQRFSDYPEFLDSVAISSEIITNAENERFKTDHAVLGFYLARSWGLDRDIADIIRDHHNAAELLNLDASGYAHATMLAILKMAEHIDKLFWGVEHDSEWQQIEQLVFEVLGISKPDFEDMRDDMLEQLIAG